MPTLKLDRKVVGRRTLFFEGDLHVGTIYELARPTKADPGQYTWYSAHGSGPATGFEQAYDRMCEAIER